MSTTIARRHRIQLTIAAGALVFALVGGITSAFAQAAGGGRGGGDGGGAAGSPDQNAVLVYGGPGNCPPTIACGHPYDPPVVKQRGRAYDPCGDLDKRSVKYRECRRQF